VIVDVASIIVLGPLGEVRTAEDHVDVGGIVQLGDRARKVAFFRPALFVELAQIMGESSREGEGDVLALLDCYGWGRIGTPGDDGGVGVGILAGGAVEEAGEQEDRGQERGG